MNSIFINNKTGNKYLVVGKAINSTNKDAGKIMVIYHHVNSQSGFFVREETEFNEKFQEQPTCL